MDAASLIVLDKSLGVTSFCLCEIPPGEPDQNLILYESGQLHSSGPWLHNLATESNSARLKD